MKAIQLRSHVGADGMLSLQVPTGTSDADLDVLVVVSEAAPAPQATHDWSEFVARTSCSVPDAQFVRHPQGDYETRDPIG